MALENNTLGIVLWRVFSGPGNTDVLYRGEAREDFLLRSLNWIAQNPRFRCVEMTHIKSHLVRKKAINLLRKSGLEVIYSAQPVQLYNEDNLIASSDISSLDELERQNAVERIFRCIDEALELGAEKFCLIGGKDPGTSSGLEMRRQAINQLITSLDDICGYADRDSEGKGRKPITVVLEPYDRLAGEEFFNQLIGPSSEAVEVARTIRNVYGHLNFGILYDLGQMPFLKGASFQCERPEILRLLKPYLVHVHLGNCVTERENRLYGNRHVRMDHPNGSIDKETLASFIKVLNEIEYSGGISFEIQPINDEIPEDLVITALALFDEARERMDVNYAPGRYYFSHRASIPESVFDIVTETRIKRRDLIQQESESRIRAESLSKGGRLVLVIADHPSRYDLVAKNDTLAGGDRQEYISRVVRALIAGGVDGVIASADIMEELMLLNALLKENGGEDFLKGKVLVGSLNTGGIVGAEYELYDPLTLYRNPEKIVAAGLDGAKLSFRLAIPDRFDRYAIQTMERCAQALEDCHKRDLLTVFMPLPCEKRSDGYRLLRDTESLIKITGVVSALSSSSQGIWLGLPYADRFDEVATSTTCPILIAQDQFGEDPVRILMNVERGIGSGSNVRGALLGFDILYPDRDDPAALAGAIAGVVHEDLPASRAVKLLAELRGQKMDAFAGMQA